MSSPSPARLALIACRVLEGEIAHLLPTAPQVVRTEFFEVGLHDRPAALRTELSRAIERAEAEPKIDAIALVYGVCGMGTVGLRARRCRLVLPRAHDCLTLFLGSKERYAEIMRRIPDVYWYTPGWNRARRVPGPEREAALRAEYTAKFGAEDAEALLAMERDTFRAHGRAVYTDFRLSDSDAEKAYAQRCANWLGWSYEEQPGDPSLLSALLRGNWDPERFLVIEPGQEIAFSADDRVVKPAAIAPADCTSSCAPLGATDSRPAAAADQSSTPTTSSS